MFLNSTQKRVIFFPFQKYGSRNPAHFSNFWSPPIFGFWSQSAREVPKSPKIGLGGFKYAARDVLN